MMKIVDREIQLMNNIINAAIKFGGDPGGPYLMDEDKTEFISSVNSWLKNRGLADTYELVKGDLRDDWWYRIQRKDLSQYRSSGKPSRDEAAQHLVSEQRAASALGLSLTDYYVYCRLKNRFNVLLELMSKPSPGCEDCCGVVDSFTEVNEEYHKFLRDHNLDEGVDYK